MPNCSAIRKRHSPSSQETCRLAAALGATIVVLHLWELPIGDRRFAENLALLPACLDVAAGVTLAVETSPARWDHRWTMFAARSSPTNGAA